MADPFAREGKSTAVQWVPGGSFGYPLQRQWTLDNAVVHGFYASGWVYSCAMILANHVASVPWAVWETDSNGELHKLSGHWAEGLIEHPNGHQTRAFQMKLRTLHLCMGGNCLDKVIMLRSRPDELWALRPDSTFPIPDKKKWLSHWEVRPRDGGAKETLDPKVVVHGQLPDPSDPYWGMSPLRAIGKVVDMDVSQVTWNRQLMENDAAPAGVFIDPAIQGEHDRKLVKAALKKKLSGPLHAREPLVLSKGAQWLPLGIPPKELDWIESRKFTVGEICTAYGLLTSRFLMDAATYNNLSTAIRYEWESGALPLCGLIGDGLALTLLPLEERRQGLKIRPDVSGVPVLRDDIHKAAESFDKFVRNMIPPQMAASMLDLPVGSIPGGDRSYRSSTLELVTEEGDMEDEDL